MSWLRRLLCWRHFIVVSSSNVLCLSLIIASQKQNIFTTERGHNCLATSRYGWRKTIVVEAIFLRYDNQTFILSIAFNYFILSWMYLVKVVEYSNASLIISSLLLLSVVRLSLVESSRSAPLTVSTSSWWRNSLPGGCPVPTLKL